MVAKDISRCRKREERGTENRAEKTRNVGKILMRGGKAKVKKASAGVQRQGAGLVFPKDSVLSLRKSLVERQG